jgi:hypothetical protein
MLQSDPAKRSAMRNINVRALESTPGNCIDGDQNPR